jgi:hypothetical protein
VKRQKEEEEGAGKKNRMSGRGEGKESIKLKEYI